MGKITTFEDLDCWKKSREQTNCIYSSFKNCKDYGFKDQIQRATISCMNNIAEGFGRWNVKERIQFLNIAYGSVLEVRSMLYIALDQKFVSQETQDHLFHINTELMKLAQGFLRHLHSYKRYEVVSENNPINSV